MLVLTYSTLAVFGEQLPVVLALVIGPARHRYQVDQVTVTLDNQVISQNLTTKNLGVMFDPTLSLSAH